MKQSFAIVGFTTLLIFTGCGPGEKERAAEKAKEESAAKEIASLKAQLAANATREVQEVKARLELARAKDNLDEIFLALKKLESLDEPTVTNELVKVKSAIEVLQNLRVAKGEHRHEDVVNYAGELLDLFPNHTEARRDLKESGLIFNYLQAALGNLNACFAPDEKGELHFVKAVVTKKEAVKETTGEKKAEPKKETDLTTIGFNLKRASEAVDEAVKLDPQYDAALTLKKSLRQTQNTIALVVSSDIFSLVDEVRPLLATYFKLLHSQMHSSLGSRFDSPSDVWARNKNSVKQIDELFKPVLKDLEEKASFLTQFDAKDVESMTKTAKDATVLLGSLKEAALNPRGNINDYKSDYLKADEDFSKLVSMWKTSSPNLGVIVSDVAGFAKTMATFELFKKPNTRNVLEKHKALITSA